ncbi:transposase [Streptomyces cinnabarinus]|uniref:transposase n=1 Tax=Streptomyces cinnabarinus TaxID=67287 RepID=UPI003AEF36CB
MNNRQGAQLGQWIERVQADELPALHGFVSGLGQDLDAVVAWVSSPYSAGAVGGLNNKIKMLKRQMFGRANWPAPQTSPPDGPRAFMIAVVAPLRGLGTKSDPEPESGPGPRLGRLAPTASVDVGHSPVLAAATRLRSRPRMR